MFLTRAIDVMQSGVHGKGSQPKHVQEVMRTQRLELLETITAAKAFILDPGSTLFCNSLIGDTAEERDLMSHIELPYPVAWVEFDRKEIFELTSVKSMPTNFNISRESQALGATGTEIAILFDNRDPSELEIYAFKNRGPVIIEPLVVLCVPKADDGSFDYDNMYAQSMAAADILTGESDESTIEEASTIHGFLHIPLAFFAVMDNPKSGLEQSEAKTSFKARKIKDKAVKGKIAPLVRMPPTRTVLLSELGRVHNEAVRQEYVDGGHDGPKRASPRRHPVKGHLVRRDGKQYWRAPHYRGKGVTVPGYTKVVDDTE